MPHVPYYVSTFIILKVMFPFLLYFLNICRNLFQFIRKTKGILFPNEVLPMNMLAAAALPLTDAVSDPTQIIEVSDEVLLIF